MIDYSHTSTICRLLISDLETLDAILGSKNRNPHEEEIGDVVDYSKQHPGRK